MSDLAARIFGPHPLPVPALTADQRAARIRELQSSVTASHDLTRFWRDHDNPIAAAGETTRMDEALDALLDLGVGTPVSQ